MMLTDTYHSGTVNISMNSTAEGETKYCIMSKFLKVKLKKLHISCRKFNGQFLQRENNH